MPHTMPKATPSQSDNPARRARLDSRSGRIAERTAGLAPGYVQGNLCILPADYAMEFATYCQRNPKPCPLIGVGAPGDPSIPTLGEDLDIRFDHPQYRVFRDGELVAEPHSIENLWRDDLVAFVLGCSYSFEEALLDANIPLGHIERGETVAMYKTNIDTIPAGRFSGKMIVSMRAMTPANAIRAIQITSRFPDVHGAPVHIGMPAAIGIDEIDEPFDGGRPQVKDNEIPVFWACGVTPQIAVAQARPPLCITHKPGAMLVTDLLNKDLAAS